MAQYTGTPYKIATLTEEGTDTIVLGDNNATVCETYYNWRSKEECEANAKFIIKACNEYSQLVETLTICAKRLRTICEDEGATEEDVQIITIAEKVLEEMEK